MLITVSIVRLPDRFLIFHINRLNGHQRLCIPSAVVKDIPTIGHGDGHPGFARCFDKISSNWYIRGLTKQLREYLLHCLECLVLQTRRHRPYGSLQFIESPPELFHTITLNFILAMPTTPTGLDAVLTVTCRFSKRVTFIPGKSTYDAAQWASLLLERLAIGDWGILSAIISDCDAKFLSELWNKLEVKGQIVIYHSLSSSNGWAK